MFSVIFYFMRGCFLCFLCLLCFFYVLFLCLIFTLLFYLYSYFYLMFYPVFYFAYFIPDFSLFLHLSRHIILFYFTWQFVTIYIPYTILSNQIKSNIYFHPFVTYSIIKYFPRVNIVLISTKTGDGGGQNSRGCTRDLAPVGVQDSGAGQPTARHPYMLLTKEGGGRGRTGLTWGGCG